MDEDGTIDDQRFQLNRENDVIFFFVFHQWVLSVDFHKVNNATLKFYLMEPAIHRHLLRLEKKKKREMLIWEVLFFIKKNNLQKCALFVFIVSFSWQMSVNVMLSLAFLIEIHSSIIF